MVRNSSLKDCWNVRDWSQSTPFLPAVFTRNCFLKLLSMLIFPEVGGNTGRVRKIQYIVKHFSEQVRFNYIPVKELYVNECLICFKSQTPAIQYRSNKHHCFWSKFSCLFESDAGCTIFFFQFLRAKITQLVNMVFFMMQVCVQFIGPLLGIEYRLYVMRCAIRDQSLFDVCMDVRTHVNAC